MLPCTPEDVVAFTPDALAGRDPVPVFYLPHPTGREWAFFLAELTIAGLVKTTEHDLVEILKDVATEDAPSPEVAAETLAFCEKWDELADEFREMDRSASVTDAQASRYALLLKDLARLSLVYLPASPAFAVAAAARVRYENEAPIIAAECFLRGWEDVLAPNGNGEPSPLAFTQTKQRKVDAATFAKLERAIGIGAVAAIGRKAMALQQLDGATGKD